MGARSISRRIHALEELLIQGSNNWCELIMVNSVAEGPTLSVRVLTSM